MSRPLHRLRRGDVIWLELPGQGNISGPKVRPCMVYQTWPNSNRISYLAISSSPRPGDPCVPIPHTHPDFAQTGLSRDSCICLDWNGAIADPQRYQVTGTIPTDIVAEVIRRLQDLLQ